jgi:hypothetical protein
MTGVYYNEYEIYIDNKLVAVFINKEYAEDYVEYLKYSPVCKITSDNIVIREWTPNIDNQS